MRQRRDLSKVRAVEHDLLSSDYAEDELAGGHMLIGGPFRCKIVDPALPYHLWLTVEVEQGRLVCTRLEAKRKRGRQPINTQSLRVPIDEYLKIALRDHSPVHVWRRVAPGSWTLTGTNERQAVAADQQRQERADSRREVVAAYREALANPLTRDRATQEVVNRLHRSRGYVSKLLSEARRTGELKESERGRGGKPTHDDAQQGGNP